MFFEKLDCGRRDARHDALYPFKPQFNNIMKNALRQIWEDTGSMMKDFFIDNGIIIGLLVVVMLTATSILWTLALVLSWFMKKTYWFWRVIIGKSGAEQCCRRFYDNMTKVRTTESTSPTSDDVIYRTGE